jgi:hypothetical protein
MSSPVSDQAGALYSITLNQTGSYLLKLDADTGAAIGGITLTSLNPVWYCSQCVASFLSPCGSTHPATCTSAYTSTMHVFCMQSPPTAMRCLLETLCIQLCL